MVDTIKLILDKSMFVVSDISRFQKETMNSTRGYFTLVQNPSRGELKNGIYKPRLTLTKRYNCTGKFEPTLSIEFSAPKLIYGNNFDELEDNDFPNIIDRLKQSLKEMGILIFTSLLENAPISSIHYSKNIPLTDGTTPHYLISKIQEANTKLSLDINQTDYRNGGNSFKLHTSSYEVAFYDKIKDLETAKISEKRAIETDNLIQLSLFDTFRANRKFEVLRMEVRLNKRQKLGQLFRTLNITPELKFKNLYSLDISQKVLLNYLNEIDSQRISLFNYNQINSKKLLSDLIIQNPQLGLKRTIQAYGLKQVFDTFDPRELRTMFGNTSQRNWYRLIAEAKAIKLPTIKSPLNIIRQQLSTYKPLKLIDFQDKMLNNDKYDKT